MQYQNFQKFNLLNHVLNVYVTNEFFLFFVVEIETPHPEVLVGMYMYVVHYNKT